jgi:hypothetical protein
MLLVNRYSTAPRTYKAKIDSLLRAYDPVEVEAYLDLQRREQRASVVDSELLRDWVARERYAVHDALQRCSARPGESS